MKPSTVLGVTGKKRIVTYRQKHTRIRYILTFNSNHIHIWEKVKTDLKLRLYGRYLEYCEQFYETVTVI